MKKELQFTIEQFYDDKTGIATLKVQQREASEDDNSVVMDMKPKTIYTLKSNLFIALANIEGVMDYIRCKLVQNLQQADKNEEYPMD